MDTPEPIIIDLSDWTRLREVDAYALRRGIDRSAAIRELVNSGLSHLQEEV